MAITIDSSKFTPNVAEGAAASTGSSGTNNPQQAMYAGFRSGLQTGTTSLNPGDLAASLNLNVFDPTGPAARPAHYTGPWVDPHDSQVIADRNALLGSSAEHFRYNQFFMTVAQNFDPFMQKKEAMHPHWWLNRIPRGAYQLFNGTVQETRIYRGGLTTYAGLDSWQDLAPALDGSADPCGPMDYDTYQYAWETLAWSGKKTAWGSDPICIEVLKFVPKAAEQIGWILETGVKFGTDKQNVWNRDMFIYQTVMAGRSFVMTNEFRGANSPRYVYQPFCKFGDTGNAATVTANKSYVDKPFIVIDASVEMEPLNFDVLDIVRGQLKRRCPESAVGRIGGELMFALAVSEEDIEKYIRGNEEERRYWIEANPAALIQHYGFAPTTFRRWTITCDDEQLRFKLKRVIAEYTEAEAANYGGVGYKELGGKKVYIAEFVAPEFAGRAGINGAPIPVPNPEYDLAEIAIAPVFMNKVFTNLFVPDVSNIGSGTYFGPKKGLNGKWAWYNIQTKDNPDMKIGNFYGEIQIVPKPDVCVYDCISFVYRRCAQPLKSLCPAENIRVNPELSADGTAKTAGAVTPALGANGTAYFATVTLTKELPLGAGAYVKIGDKYATVIESLTGTRKTVQFDPEYDGDDKLIAVGEIADGTTVTVA